MPNRRTSQNSVNAKINLRRIRLPRGLVNRGTPGPLFTKLAPSTTSLITREPVEESSLKGPWKTKVVL
jgi:hypothetical protein